MSRKNDLIKNTAILTVGRYLPKLFTMITLPVITGVLTKTEYGTYDLVLVMVSLLLPVVTLQIQSAAFRFLIDCREEPDQAKTVISNLLVFTGTTSLAAVLVFFFACHGIAPLTRLLVCLYFALNTLHETVGQITRGLSYNRVYAANSVLYSAINMTAVLATVFFGGMRLNGVFVSLIAANALSTLYMASRIRLRRRFSVSSFSRRVLLDMLRYSWPMVPNNLSEWILRISDRLVITAFLGVEANAVYVVANKIPALVTDAQGVFTMAWQENASLAARDEDSGAYYSEVFRAFYGLVISLAYVLVAAIPVLFALLIRGDYAEAYAQMPILVIGAFFCCLCSFQSGIYVAHKKTASVGMTTIAAAAVNLIIDFALVRRIGIYAGSVSTLISYLALFLFRMRDMQRFQKIAHSPKGMLCSLALLIVMCALASRQSMILNALNVALAAGGCMVLQGKRLRRMVRRVFSGAGKRCG